MTAMAQIERVKILMQTQDANPKVLSGEIPKYTGIADCFQRVNAEQGPKAFWRGNLVNCIRYAPQQGSALAFNDAIKRAFPKYNPKTHYYQDFAEASRGWFGRGVGQRGVLPLRLRAYALGVGSWERQGAVQRHR